jgi:hypothetical protein
VLGPNPDIPPSVPIALLAGTGVILAASFLWVAFSYRRWILKAFILLCVTIWLVCTFSLIYYYDGNEQTLNYADYPAFGHALSKNEALYFTVGILTTAGTGDLSPKTDAARTAVTVQMTLDVLVLVIGIAGVVRARPKSAPASEEGANVGSGASTTTGAALPATSRKDS